MCKEEVSTLPPCCPETDAAAALDAAPSAAVVQGELTRLPPALVEAIALGDCGEGGGNGGGDLLTNGNSSSSCSPSSEDNSSTSNDNSEEKNHDETEERSSTQNKKTAAIGNEQEEKEEVFLIQDHGFSVKINAPGCEPFELQVSSMELVQEIHQVLMDHEETCHRTCFSLQLDGQILDSFAELKSVAGLKDGATLKVVEEPYTVREARIHLRHVRDLLKSLDPSDAYNSADCASLSYVNTITNGSILERAGANFQSSVDCTPPDYIMPGCKERLLSPLMPASKDSQPIHCLRLLMLSGWNPPPGSRKLHGDLLYLSLLTLEEKRFHITCCTKGFFVNQSTETEFNPKPVLPKFVSHSLIELLCHISPGFKRNFAIVQKKRCQRHPFERVTTPYQTFVWTAPQFEHSFDAIRAEDAFAFKLGYEEHIPGQTREWNEELQTTRELPRKTLPERLLRERAIFKVYSDFVAAATKGAVVVVDGNVMAINPGENAKMQMFIWNNIFFSLGFDVKDHYKEFGGDAAAFVAPNNDLQGVKAYFNLDPAGLFLLGTVIVDYMGYRVTAQSIIPGILEKDQEQSVVYGSVDFGKTVATSEKYLELLNKCAQQLKILPHKVKNDNGDVVQLNSSVESKGIVGNDGRHYILDLLRTFPPDVHYLPEADVNEVSRQNGYPRTHPHKFSCLRQELIDAFLECRYITFVKMAASYLQKLRVNNDDNAKNDGETVTVIKEAKDMNENNTVVADGSVDGQTKAVAHEHVDAAVDSATLAMDIDGQPMDDLSLSLLLSSLRNSSQLFSDMAVSKAAAIGNLELSFPDPSKPASLNDALDVLDCAVNGVIPSEETMDIAELCRSKENGIELATQEVVRRAAKAAGSLSETEFDIRFNPDCYSSSVTHSEDENLSAQRQVLKDAAEFLLTSQIPNFINDCLNHSFIPLDGISLTSALHSRGINMRYLGKILKNVEGVVMLEYLKVICYSEVICRASKHIFRSYLQGVEQSWLSSAVAHFLNCLFGSFPSPQAINGEDPALKKRSRKRRGYAQLFSQDRAAEWLHLTPKTLWQQINQETHSYFDCSLECDSIDSLCDDFGVQRISLFRRFCIMNGVQVVLKEYTMEGRSRAPFAEDDILNLFPVVKHINPKASDAYNFYGTGQAKIQQGNLRAGYELIYEAYNLLTSIYGAVHPEIAQCLRLLARLAYIMGDHQEALAQQHKAVLISERCNGIDHAQTILEYMHLALYCFADLQLSTALKLLYRARYLVLLVFGENHPYIALLDSNIGLILHAANEYELSLKFLENALKLQIIYYGKKSLKVALTYHLLARIQSCRGDFRTALQYEKETFTIYKSMLGEDHEKTKESGDCLKHLTEQAVSFQKRMNEITRNSGVASHFLPIQIHSPSLASVLDILNIINGIVFVHINAKSSDSQCSVGVKEVTACSLGTDFVLASNLDTIPLV